MAVWLDAGEFPQIPNFGESTIAVEIVGVTVDDEYTVRPVRGGGEFNVAKSSVYNTKNIAMGAACERIHATQRVDADLDALEARVT